MHRLTSIKGLIRLNGIAPAPPPTDYVAYISMNVATFIPNTTKDATGTYILFADNIIMLNDPTRGYVLTTVSGAAYGIRLESPIVTNWIPSYSYSIWVNITSALLTTTPNGIIGDYLVSAGSFFLYWTSTGVLTCTHGSSYTADVLSGPTFSTLNTWNHITITYNNTTLVMTMYLNGAKYISKTKSAAWTGFGSTTGGKMSFGYANLGGVTKQYTGDLDNMRVYGRELSSNEVYNIYSYEKENPTSS